VPDVVGLLVVVVDDHDIADHFVPGIDAKWRTLVVVDIGLCEAADWVGDIRLLPRRELQVKAIQKIGLVDFS
jgi:hypothetical protein